MKKVLATTQHGKKAKSDRTATMKKLREQAREYAERGDVVMAAQTAETWRTLATASEADRAPRYLWWPGRRS